MQIMTQNTMDMDTPFSLISEIRSLNKVFQQACSQVILLNHKIEEAKARYDRARSDRRLSFRYSYRLRLTVLEGVRNLTYEYACNKCEEIEDKQARLRQLTGDVYASSSDYSESDDNEENNEEQSEQQTVDSTDVTEEQ